MKRRTRIRLLLSILFLTLCLVIAINLVPLLFDINSYKGLIERELSSYTGTSVSIGSLQFAIKNGIELEINNISIRDSKSLSDIASAGKIKLLIKITPLIKEKTIVIRKLYLQEPDIMLKRDREGELNISRVINRIYSPMPELNVERDRGAGIEKSWLKTKVLRLREFFRLYSFSLQDLINDIKITNGRLTFIDQFVSENHAPLIVNQFNIVVEKPIFSRKIRLKINGIIPDWRGPAMFDVNGIINEFKDGLKNSSLEGHLKVDSLPFSVFGDYIKGYPSFKQIVSYQPLATSYLDIDTSIKGNLSEGFESSGDINLKLVNFNDTGVVSAPLKSRYGSIKYTVNLNKDSLEFKNLQFKAGDLFINGKCSIYGIRQEESRITFDLSSPKVDINKEFKHISKNIVPPHILNRFEEVVKGGELEIRNIKFSGNVNQLTTLTTPSNFKLLSGLADVRNLDLDIDKGKYPFRGLNGVITLKEGEMLFADVRGMYKDCKITNMNGSISKIFPTPFLNLLAKGDIEAGKVKELISDDIYDKYKQNIKEESGIITAEVKISGPIDDPTPFDIGVDAELNGINMQYADLKLPFQNVNGSIHFSPKELYIKNVSWDMGDSRFSMNGTVSEIKSQTPFLDINLNSMLNLSDAGNLGLNKIVRLSMAEGTSELNLRLKGKKGNFTISESLDLTNVTYKYDPWFEKNIGSFNQIQFKARVNSNTIYIDDMEVSLESAKINIKGKVKDFNNPRFLLSIHTNEININDIVRFLTRVSDTDASGVASLQLDTAGYLKNLKATKFKGKLSIRDADFRLIKFPLPIKSLNTTAEFTGKRVFIPLASGTIGDSPFKFSASINEFLNPVINFTLQASSINMDELSFPKSEEDVSEVEEKETLFSRAVWRGKIAVDKGEFRGIPLENLMFSIFYNKDIVKVKNILFKGFNGAFTGKGWFQRDRVDGMELFIENRIINMNIENLYEKLPEGFRNLHGSLNMTSKISGKGRTMDEMKRSLNGDVSLNMNDGSINKFHILSKIFSLLNVYQIFKFKLPDMVTEGMPYNSITANFEIKDGIASTKDFLINSDSMRITAVGETDIKDKHIDMIVGVQPFQTIDKLVSNIPLAGRILTGDKKALIVFYYTVKETLDNPEVTAIPFESLGEGLLTTFKRLFLTPKELFYEKK
jgi:uncharacterized protein YhdP